MRGDISNDELVLSHAISDPVQPHVDCFAALLFDAVSYDSNSGSVVAHDDGRFLRIAHVGQSCSL